MFFVDDRSGFGNLYLAGPDAYGEPQPLYPAELEFGLPQWVFGQRTYAVLDSDTLLVTYIHHGRGRSGILARQASGQWQLQPLADELVEFSGVAASTDAAYALAACATRSGHLVQLIDELWQPFTHEPSALPPDGISRAVPFNFDTPDGPGHAFFYAPESATASAPAGSLPPFITICHGGPTGASSAAYSDRVQFWTSRGFAVIDVNYRGSTGFGRAYREALDGQWGVADAEDCANAARTAIERGWVSRRGAIRGSSAGGLTVLRALLDTDVFTAGVVLYGVLDLTRLVADTHKFEQHYTDSLIAPWPEGRAVYEARSPAAARSTAARTRRQPLPLRIVRWHHERWDGRGYPLGLPGRRIPLIARIIAVADTYDAMTSDRAYRRALPHEVTVNEIERCSGSQFDPDIAGVFTEQIDRLREALKDAGETIPE